MVIAGANASVDAAQVASAKKVLEASAIVVCQGEIPRDGIEALPALVAGRFLHNPAPVMELDPAVLRASNPLVVNEHEAALVLAQVLPPTPRRPIARSRSSARCARPGSPRWSSPSAPRDRCVADPEGLHRIPAAPVTAVDTTGAGDAFIGALAVGLARGESLPAAARLASQVGAYAATGNGAQPSYPSTGDELPPLAEVNA